MDPNNLVNSGQQQAESNFSNDFANNAPTGSIGSTLDQANQALNQAQPTTTAPPANTNQPSLLDRLLPTAGGILGGLGAGALDVVSGGLAIPFDAAIVGAGSALGKVGEDARTHQSLTKGVLSSGLEGAVGQGIGEGVISPLLGKAGSLANGLADNITAKTAADAASSDAESAANGALDKATAYKNNYGSISPKLQTDLDLGTNGKFVDSLGGDGSSPYDMNAVSQGGQELNSVYNDALEKSPDVNMTDFGNNIFKTMQASGTTDLSTTPLGKALSDYQMKAGVAPNATLPDTMPATEVRSLQQSVGKQIGNTQKLVNNATLNGVSNTEAENQLTTLQQVYKDLGNRIKTPEADKAIAGTNVDDNARTALEAQYGQAHGDYIADTINNAKTGDDLLTPMQQYTKMGQASRMAIDDIENAPGTPRALAREKANIPSAPAKGGLTSKIPSAIDMGGMAESVLGHNPVVGTSMMVANHLAQNPAVLRGIGGALTGVAGSAAPGIVGGIVGNSPNDIPGAAGTGNNIQSNTGQSMNPQNSLLDQALYEAIQNPLNGGMNQVGTLLPLVQKQNEANQAEQQLVADYNKAGGAQGPVGGILNTLGSTFTGGEAASLPAQESALAGTIANATGVPIQQVEQELPKINQNQTAAQASLNNIQGLIQALQLGGNTSQGLVSAVQQ